MADFLKKMDELLKLMKTILINTESRLQCNIK